jgi:hypothetical protein
MADIFLLKLVLYFSCPPIPTMATTTPRIYLAARPLCGRNLVTMWRVCAVPLAGDLKVRRGLSSPCRPFFNISFFHILPTPLPLVKLQPHPIVFICPTRRRRRRHEGSFILFVTTRHCILCNPQFFLDVYLKFNGYCVTYLFTAAWVGHMKVSRASSPSYKLASRPWCF